MKRKLAVIALIALVVVGVVLLVRYNSRDLWIGKIRDKYGAKNPALATDSYFTGKTPADLRVLYALGQGLNK